MLRIWGILVFSFVVISGYSQDQYGLSTGQYAGIDGLRLNPSAISGSAYYMDIKLLGSSFLLTNNYVFLPRESYSPFMLLRSNPEFKQFTDELGHDRYLDEKYDTRLKNAYLGIDINGPGAMVQLGRHAAGITTAFRSRLYAKNIPYEIAKFGYESFDYDSLYDINFINEKDVHLDQINYLDIGFTYSYIAYARNRDKLDMGVTLHYLKPQSAFKLYFDRMDYLLPDGDSLIIFDLDGDIKMSLPVSYDDNSYPDGSGFFKGSGLGLDVGFTYTKTIRFQSRYDRFARPCRQKQYDYQYRMAVALLDVGWVSMKKMFIITIMKILIPFGAS